MLDEPANGLDPAEVRALRGHLTAIAAAGTAVLISSHLLAEVEMLASHVVVIEPAALVRRPDAGRADGGRRGAARGCVSRHDRERRVAF